MVRLAGDNKEKERDKNLMTSQKKWIITDNELFQQVPVSKQKITVYRASVLILPFQCGFMQLCKRVHSSMCLEKCHFKMLLQIRICYIRSIADLHQIQANKNLLHQIHRVAEGWAQLNGWWRWWYQNCLEKIFWEFSHIKKSGISKSDALYCTGW